MLISSDEITTLRELCLLTLPPAIKRLCDVGALPRPPRGRFLRLGQDYFHNELDDIQEVSKLVDFLKSQALIKSLYVRQDNDTYVLFEIWRRLLTDILADTDGTTVSNAVFNKWFVRFIGELYKESAVWRSVDVIDGLVMDCKQLKLDKYSSLISLRCLTQYDPWHWLDALVPRHDHYFDSVQFAWDTWKNLHSLDKATVVVTTMTIPKAEYQPRNQPLNKLKQIERSLATIESVRLLKPGTPKLIGSAVFHLSNFPLDDPFGYSSDKYGRLMYEKDTTISRHDYQHVTSLWREIFNDKCQHPLMSRNTTSPMEIAEARFFNSYETKGWFENILDLTISLEALFSPSDHEELSHRIALRCAWLLQQQGDMDGTLIGNVYNQVKAMYDVRSKIVHGASPKQSQIRKWIGKIRGKDFEESKSEWEQFESSLESARDLVRKSLCICRTLSKLSKDGPHWPLPDDFDALLVNNKQRATWQIAAGILPRSTR